MQRHESVPNEVAGSWTAAGAKIGWCEGGTSIYFPFESEPDFLEDPIPAFRFSGELNPQAEILNPDQPFGVRFDFSTACRPNTLRLFRGWDMQSLDYRCLEFTDEDSELLLDLSLIHI